MGPALRDAVNENPIPHSLCGLIEGLDRQRISYRNYYDERNSAAGSTIQSMNRVGIIMSMARGAGYVVSSV
jgi:hypothetical protein